MTRPKGRIALGVLALAVGQFVWLDLARLVLGGGPIGSEGRAIRVRLRLPRRPQLEWLWPVRNRKFDFSLRSAWLNPHWTARMA